MKPPMTPTLAMFIQSSTRTGMMITPMTRQIAVTSALFSQTWNAKSAAGFSRVVVGEVVVDQLLDLGVGEQRLAQSGGVDHAPADQERHARR